MTRQSIDLGKNSLAKKMEARVRLAHARLGRRILYEGGMMARVNARHQWLQGHVVAVAVARAGWLAASPVAQAQHYPSRAVKIIVPFPAGGTADVMPRIFSDWLAKKWGEPVVIENRSGAAGNIGA